MSNDLMIFSSLDQSLPLDKRYEKIKEQIDSKINEAITEADINKASELVRELITITKISGRELSRVLYQFESNWSVFQTDETFDDWAYRTSGLHEHTIERYVKVEKLFNHPEVPETVKQELNSRNIGEIIPVANMIAEGYELTHEQWDDLLTQPDQSSIRETIREIKKIEPRATALLLKIDDMGSIWVTKGGMRKFVGSLEVLDEDEVIQHAIERIIKNSGILK